MIGFKIGDTWLDLPPDLSVQLEVMNSLFETDRIPGSLVLPFTLPESQVNQIKLMYPGEISIRRNGRMAFNIQMYVEDQLYRTGKLNVLRKQKKGGYSVNFQTDIGDIEAGLKENSLRDIDLGTGVLLQEPSEIYPAANYALFPVKNAGFYQDKEPAFCKYLNYYHGGAFGSFFVNNGSREHAVTPFPYLVYILEKVMASFGYRITGSWLEEEEVRRLVIYNTTALDEADLSFSPEFQYNRHVPDMKVNEFLKGIRSLLGLGFIFNTTAKTMKVVRLKDVIRDNAYVDWTDHTAQGYEWEPNSTNGFILIQAEDSDDELYSTLGNSWTRYQVGAGKDDINCGAGTLPMLTETDEKNPGRQWLIPQANQKGNSDHVEIGQNKFGLRLLSYRGMQPDSIGNNYPLGTSGIINYAGASVGTASLLWDGPNGLYELAHKDWLEFRSNTEMVETEQLFRISDLLSLNQERKAMIHFEEGTMKGLWDKVTVSINNKTGIQMAKVPLFKVPY